MGSKGQAVRHLGSVALAAVLLGLPRALEGRTFGSPRSVYVDVAALAPELTDFSAELKRAIGEAGSGLAGDRSEATTVVELLAVARCQGTDGRPMEAASFAIRDARGERPVVLHYAAGQKARAARALLESLSRPRA